MLRTALLALVLSLPLSAQQPFTVQPIATHAVDNVTTEVRLVTQTSVRPTMAAQVPLAYSDLHMQGPMRFKGLSEEGLLGSFFEIDLNSDGQLDELFVDPFPGGARIDQMGMEAISAGPGQPEHPYREDGSLKRYRLGPDAVDLFLRYYEPPYIALYLGHLAHVPQVKTFPSPSLLVHVFEACQGYQYPWDEPKPPSFQLALNPAAPADGSEPHPRAYYSWQPFPLDPARGQVWTRGQWVMLPMKGVGQETFTLTVAATTDTPFIGVKAEVCYAPDDKTCVRTPAQTTLVWAPPKR